MDFVDDVARSIAALERLDLHGAELRGVRLALGSGNVPEMYLELLLAGDRPLALRCRDVSTLSLADFDAENVVSSYTLVPNGLDEDGRRTLHLTLSCAPGCDVDLRCREVTVMENASDG
jgi:hypothetical protein